MNLRLVLITLLLTPATHAVTLESRTLGKIGRARTANEVVRIEAEYRELKEARAACQIQWRRQWIPSACYEVLQIESKMGMHARAGVKRSLRQRLDRRCEELAAKIYLEGAETSVSADADSKVSPECRRQIRKANEILRYRAGGRPDWSEY
jgi:hypothetical protein